jgi:hypothetical protein
MSSTFTLIWKSCQNGFINLGPVEEPQDSVGFTLSPHSHVHFFLLELRHRSVPHVCVLVISTRFMEVLKLVLWSAPSVKCFFLLLPHPCSAKPEQIRSYIFVQCKVLMLCRCDY